MWCTSRASPVSTISADLGALAGAHQVLVHRGGQQQRRDRGVVGVAVPVGEHEDPGAGLDRLRALAGRPASSAAASAGPPPCTRNRPSTRALGSRAGRRRRRCARSWPGRRCRSPGTAARSAGSTPGRRRQQVLLRADGAGQRGDQLLPDRVQRRVGDLGEQFGEVVEQQPGPLATARRSGVSVPIEPIGSAAGRPSGRGGSAAPPRCSRKSAGGGAPTRGCRRRAPASGSVVEVHQPGVQPLAVRVLGGQLGLDLVVGADPAAPRCRPGTSGPAAAAPWRPRSAGSRSSTPASLASTTRPSAVRHQRPGRSPLRSSTAPMTVPSVKATQAGPSHGSIRHEWNS